MRALMSSIKTAAMVGIMLLMWMLLVTHPAKAVEIINSGRIEAEQIVDDDVFIVGENVVVDGVVNGDLFAAGSTVTINGRVKGSIAIAAQKIMLNGKVDGSVYAAASALTVDSLANIGRNIYFAGFALTTNPGSLVGQDLLFSGYQGIIAGQVKRDVRISSAALEIEGTIGRNINAIVAEPDEGFSVMPSFFSPPGAPAMISPGLRIAEGAKIGGMLTYTSAVDQTQAIQASPVEGVVYQTPKPEQRFERVSPRPEVIIGKWFLARLRELVTLLVLGGLAVWLMPSLLNQFSERARTTPLPAAGWGLLVVIVGYAAIALLAAIIITIGIILGLVTLGGLARSVFGLGFSSLGVVITIFNLLVVYGSKIIISFLTGKLLLQRFAPDAAEHKVWPLLLGVVIYVLLRSIPLVGWMIGLMVTLVGMGVIWLVYQDKTRPKELQPG